MKLRLADLNVIVVAHQFNPSVFNQLWLTKHGLATEGEVTGDNCAFTNAFAQIVTEQASLLVTPNHLQLSVRPEVSQVPVILDKVNRIVTLLPHTPFTAIGLNFHYQCVPEKRDVREISKELFFVPSSPLHKNFAVPDARFGGYASKDVLDCRLRLEVKPMFAPVAEGGPPEHFLAMSFNFNRDLKQVQEPAEAIRSVLEKWGEANTLARQIAESVANEVE